MKNFINKSNNKGFTLIELLVVISVIAILIGLSIFGVQGAFESARDTKRKADIRQYQNALETYANKNNSLFYSSGTMDPSGNSGLCTAVNAAACPDDPVAGQSYQYQSNGPGLGGADATRYVLWARLENPSSPTTYWVACSNGKSGTAGVSVIPPSTGVCPI